MDSEEGEIFETCVSTPGEVYEPAYEWPGESSGTSFPFPDPPSISRRPATTLRTNQPTFRLIVLRTSILSSEHRLGVIDGHSEIQFGRDLVPAGSTMPKIRLKEMEVSKLHATAYWDASRREWGVVDMGSVHGTFLRPASVAGDDRGTRLSSPRQASIPRKLNHLDQLTIGGTTFLVHMHQDRLPCEECQTDGNHEIPLHAVPKGSKVIAAELHSTSRAAEEADSYAPKEPKDPKKALTMLKKSLLTRHSDSSLRPHSTPTEHMSPQYVDRSARRRALMPATTPDAPGVSTPPVLAAIPLRVKSPVVEPTSQPPVPLPPSNIGHRLLMKQGWEPGTALGSPLESYDGRVGLVEPIEPTASLDRGGLGLKRASTTSLPALNDHDWKESAKRRRWERS
ncbi:hypothetical protein H0H87_007651 [Tephrocybe sp. NHM501043]|nr:hypothetical protein H0H87_007651 [Tephrocybe sp. NHM501043]